jgi:hypothetical protein
MLYIHVCSARYSNEVGFNNKSLWSGATIEAFQPVVEQQIQSPLNECGIHICYYAESIRHVVVYVSATSISHMFYVVPERII